MKRFRLHRLFAVVTFISILSITMFAEVRECNKVKIEYDNLADGSIRVINVWNDGNKRIDLSIDGEIYTVKANSSGKPNKIAKKFVRYDSPQDSGGFCGRFRLKKRRTTWTVYQLPMKRQTEIIIVAKLKQTKGIGL